MTTLEPTRRNILTGIAAAGLATPVLAACGSDDDPAAATDQNGTTGSTSPSGSPAASGTSGAGGDAIKTADIPVGGGKIFKNDEIVVTQPTAGEFKAFSAVCPHQGCILTQVKDGAIDCSGCHGSVFSIEDGSVEKGPATKGLTAKTVTVSGDSLTVT